MELVFIFLTEWPLKTSLRQSCAWPHPLGSQLRGFAGGRGGPFESSDERSLTKAF